MNSSKHTIRTAQAASRRLHPLALAIGLACFGLQVSAQDAAAPEDAEQAARTRVASTSTRSS